jgi:hypothetical protein
MSTAKTSSDLARGSIVTRDAVFEPTTSGSVTDYVLVSPPLGVPEFVPRLTSLSPFSRVIAQLHQLGSLRPGWNGHDAAPVEPKSVHRAIEFLQLLHGRYQGLVTPPIVGPLPDGGAVLVWRTEKKEVEISFVDQGENVETAITDRRGERPEEFHERVGMDSLLSVFVPEHLIGG